MPAVSVVVPVYNVKELLPLCLDSIARQTFADFECILVDDGSTDGSAEVCDAYAAKDGRFRVIHKANGGVCSARNAGAAAAAADYVVYCDQDDLFAPRLLELALEAQRRFPEDLIVWPYTREREAFAAQPGAPEHAVYDRRHLLDYLAGDMMIYVWNKLLPRSVLTAMPALFDESLIGGGEDFDFIARFLPVFFCQHPGGCVRQIGAPLYFWNPGNEKSVSRWDSNSRGYSLRQLAFFAKIKQAFPDFYDQDEEQIARCFNRLVRPMVFGFSLARKNGESLEPFWNSPELAEMLGWLRDHRWYLGLYPPLRLRSAALGRRMLAWMDDNPRLYGLCYGVFYHLLAHGWNHL